MPTPGYLTQGLGQGSNIVNDPYGPPHQYGSTIWDVFRPRPQDEQQLLQNLYGQGYLGQGVDQVQEEGSPFRRLMQGIGIMNAPEPRALTPWEQYTYQRGLHERGSEDQRTEQQRIQLLQSEENLGQDVAKTGQMPSGAPWNLPPEMSPGFENIVKDYGETGSYVDQKRKLDLQNAQAELDWRNKRMQADSEAISEQKHLQNISKVSNMGPYKMLLAQYKKVIDAANAEPNQMQKGNLMAQAAQLQQQVRNYLGSIAAPSGDITLSPSDINMLSNFGTDVFAPFTKTPSGEQNIVQSPEDVDRALQEEMGASAGQYPFGAP